MHFGSSFYFHFILSFIGFLFLGIYLCRGSWRNTIRTPLPLAIALVLSGHLIGAPGPFSVMGSLVLIVMGFTSFFLARRNVNFAFSEVRDGHNLFSLLVGAALFALTVQLHSVLFGVPVFQLVK